jgi:hypothetical protein
VKRLWIVTLSNVAATGLLILIIYAILQVIGIAAYTTTWPLFVLLPIVLTLSIVGLRLARKTKSAPARWVGYAANGCALAIPTVVILCIGTLFLSATREKYIIPAGYKGHVYVVHGIANGKPLEKTFCGITYRISKDGILITQAPTVHNFTITKYYYGLNDGTLQRIHYEWYSTIDDTPQNRANYRDIGVYFPRSGHFFDPTGCQFEYEEIYVGTMADILSNPKEKDFTSYLRDHHATCLASTK